MGILSVLDRRLRLWHVVTVNAIAISWFVGLTLASRSALPGVALFRCPIGFCAGGYSPEELYSIMDEIGEEGRAFLQETLLPIDVMLPLLLLGALLLDIIWFSRPGGYVSLMLQPSARWMLLAVPMLYAVADYLENAALAQILRLYPDISDAMAERASYLTAAKSQLVAASVGIAVALAVAAWGATFHPSHPPPPPDET